MMNMTPAELSGEGVRDPQVGPDVTVLACGGGWGDRDPADRHARVGRLAADPEHRFAREEAGRKFRRAFERLSPREREVAVLLYVQNLTLREIGEVLEVSESRVSQIHSQLKQRIRERLRHDSRAVRRGGVGPVSVSAVGLGAFIGVGRSLDQALGRVERAEELGYESVFVTHIAGATRSRCSRATRPHLAREAGDRRHPHLRQDAVQHGAVVRHARRVLRRQGDRRAGRLAQAGGGGLVRPVHRQAARRDAGVRGDHARDPAAARTRRPARSSAPPSSSPDGTPPRPDMPIYLAGLSPGMLRLSGEIADGVVLWLCNPNYIRDVVVPSVREGAEKAGRDLDGFDIVAAVPSSVTGDPDAARARLREEVTPTSASPTTAPCSSGPASTRTPARPTSSSGLSRALSARGGGHGVCAPLRRERRDLAVRRRDRRHRLRRDARSASSEPRLASARPRGGAGAVDQARLALGGRGHLHRGVLPFTSMPRISIAGRRTPSAAARQLLGAVGAAGALPGGGGEEPVADLGVVPVCHRALQAGRWWRRSAFGSGRRFGSLSPPIEHPTGARRTMVAIMETWRDRRRSRWARSRAGCGATAAGRRTWRCSFITRAS